MDAETVLHELADEALDESNSITAVLKGILTFNLAHVGPHVDLDALVVAAGIRVDEVGVEGVLLVGTIVVSSDGGVCRRWQRWW